jgi:hypothetical protein
MLNKKGQVGETLTWIVATIIIVVVLLFFLFGSSLLAETKSIKVFKQSLFSSASYEGDDLFLKKSLFSYTYLTNDAYKKKFERYLYEKSLEGNFINDYNETKISMLRKLT